MEWKIISGQLCTTGIAITCIIFKVNSGLLYLAIGGLLASIGYPFIIKKE